MERMFEEDVEDQGEAAGAVGAPPAPEPTGRPADRIRAAVGESAARGAPMVSAQLMQAKLFSVYDDAAAVPEALALVQQQLRLTLDRTWYSAHEVEDLADQLDWMLGLASAGPAESEAEPDADGAEPAAAATG